MFLKRLNGKSQCKRRSKSVPPTYLYVFSKSETLRV